MHRLARCLAAPNSPRFRSEVACRWIRFAQRSCLKLSKLPFRLYRPITLRILAPAAAWNYLLGQVWTPSDTSGDEVTTRHGLCLASCAKRVLAEVLVDRDLKAVVLRKGDSCPPISSPLTPIFSRKNLRRKIPALLVPQHPAQKIRRLARSSAEVMHFSVQPLFDQNHPTILTNRRAKLLSLNQAIWLELRRFMQQLLVVWTSIARSPRNLSVFLSSAIAVKGHRLQHCRA